MLEFEGGRLWDLSQNEPVTIPILKGATIPQAKATAELELTLGRGKGFCWFVYLLE